MNRFVRVAAHVLASALLGAGLAAIAYFLFFRGTLAGLNLVVWALVAVAVGLFVRSWAMTILDCAILGFTIVLAYSIVGYGGTQPLSAAIPAFALIALAGALGMAAAGALAHLVLTRVGRRGAKR